jgi:glycosyltransferase involved in cell wall biosynthesis
VITPFHIAVLIPARNEEALLPRCLRSLLAAKQLLPLNVTCEVIVASDGSSDATAEIAEFELGLHGVVSRIHAGSVGAARALAAEMALSRYRGNDLTRCWFANTDADCEVPLTWLVDQWRLAVEGVHAVVGIVDVDCFTEHLPHVEASFRVSYRINSDGTHPHVHGANLGVCADAYCRAGGWSALATAEDHDLWRRLGDVGAVRRSVAELKVITSGRRLGRAPLGFADALAAHNERLPPIAEVAA